MMFEKKLKKALGQLYVCKTAGEEQRIKEVIHGLSRKGTDYRVRVLMAIGEVKRKAQGEMYALKLNAYGTPKANPKTRVLNYWKNRKHHDSWTHVFIIRAGNEAEALKVADLYIDIHGGSCTCEHDCCGHAFHTGASARLLTAGRYIVHQWGGLNV